MILLFLILENIFSFGFHEHLTETIFGPSGLTDLVLPTQYLKKYLLEQTKYHFNPFDALANEM